MSADQRYLQPSDTEQGFETSQYNASGPAPQYSSYPDALYSLDTPYMDQAQFPGLYDNGHTASQTGAGAADLTLDTTLDNEALKGFKIEDLTQPAHARPWNDALFAHESYNVNWLPSSGMSTDASPTKLYEPILRADSGYETLLAGPIPVSRAPVTKQEPSNSARKRQLSRASSPFGASDLASQAGTTSGKRKSVTNLPPCSECGKIPLHKSDQTKHAKTHSRPYKCSVTTCADHIKGFGTINDRDRHEMSKHEIYKAGVTYYGYVCPACPRSSTGKEKWWPRADNFKSHVKRKHPTLNIEATMSNARRLKEMDDNMTVITGYNTTHAGQSIADSELQYQQPDDRLATTPHGGLDLSDPSIMNDFPSWLQRADSNPMRDAGVGLGAHFDGIDNMQLLQDFDPHDPPSLLPAYATPSSQQVHGFAEPGPAHIHDAIRFDHIGLSGQPQLQSNTNSNKRRRVDENIEHEQQSEDALPRFCEHCGKSGENLRPCDMRKHISRHNRRYGCTEPRCYDKHGSKSDWYRHEDRLHKLPAAYLCRIANEQGQFCNEYCRSQQTYRQHLATVHCYSDGKDIAQKLEEMILPKEGRHRFWCGFCRDVVPNPDTRDPWNARCIHVGKHMDLSGGKTILEWICPEMQMPKGQITEEQKRTFKNKHVFPQLGPR